MTNDQTRSIATMTNDRDQRYFWFGHWSLVIGHSKTRICPSQRKATPDKEEERGCGGGRAVMSWMRLLTAASIVFAAAFQTSTVRCQEPVEAQPGPGAAPASAANAQGTC